MLKSKPIYTLKLIQIYVIFPPFDFLIFKYYLEFKFINFNSYFFKLNLYNKIYKKKDKNIIKMNKIGLNSWFPPIKLNEKFDKI